MDDTLTIIIITIAVCYILFTTYKNDYFTIQPQNNTIKHLPYNHVEPPNIYKLGNEQEKGYYQENDNITEDIHTLNDIDDIIHNYENINYNHNHIERKQNKNYNYAVSMIVNEVNAFKAQQKGEILKMTKAKVKAVIQRSRMYLAK